MGLIHYISSKKGKDLNRRAKLASTIARINEPHVVKMIKKALSNIGVVSYFIDNKQNDRRQRQYEHLLRRQRNQVCILICASIGNKYILELYHSPNMSIQDSVTTIEDIEACLSARGFIAETITKSKMVVWPRPYAT